MDSYMILDELSSSELELNLPKILKLSDSERDLVIKLFDDMMFACHNGMEMTGGIAMHPIKLSILYRTLYNQGYLINSRGAKLDELLD